MKQNQFEFKPLDQVLVRDTDRGIWKVTLFSHYDGTCENYKHVTVSGQYTQCIPYNEETAHLLGTNEPYREPKKREWYVSSKGNIEFAFTTEEFEHFLTNMVVNNKDVTDFHVKYMPNN